MSEVCCTLLAGNAGPKKSPKQFSISQHRTTLSNYVFVSKACIDNRKNVLNSNSPPHVLTVWRTTAL